MITLRVTLAVAVSSCVLPGCSDAEPTVNPSAPPAVLEILEYARDSDLASDEQIAVLELAASEGREVTEAEYRAAYALAVDCTRDAGVTVVEVDEIYGRSLELYMTVQGQIEDEEFMFTAMGNCEETHARFLGDSLQVGAAAKEFVLEVERQYRPLVIACLQAKGVAIADNASMADAVEVDIAWREDNGVTDGCIQETGMNAELSGN